MSSPEMVNFNHSDGRKKKKSFFLRKSSLFLVFFLIVGLLLITTVYRGVAFPFFGALTGRVVGVFSGSGDTSNYFDVSMNLTVPELDLKGDYGRIVILGSSNTPLMISNYEITLREDGFTEIILEEFSGKISLDENGITFLDGKVMGATINGIPIVNSKGKKISITTISNLRYESINFQEEIRFRKLDYIASGNIVWENTNQFRLNNEKIEISNFIGTILIRNRVINFEGIVENVRSRNFRLK